MTEDHHIIDAVETSDGVFSPLRTKDRVFAVLNTLRSNRTVWLDMGTTATVTGAFSAVDQPVMGIIFGFGTSMVHPVLNRIGNESRVLKAEIKKFPIELNEERHFVGILVDAWKTGKTQSNTREIYTPKNLA